MFTYFLSGESVISCSALFPLCLPNPDVGPGSPLAAMLAALEEFGVMSELACKHCILAWKSLWKRRRKISFWCTVVPPGEQHWPAHYESPLPNLSFLLCFSLTFATAILFSSWPIPRENPEEETKKWLVKYRGRRLDVQIHRMVPPFCLQGFFLREHLV